MSKLETNTIDTISGSTTLTLGGTNATTINVSGTLQNNGSAVTSYADSDALSLFNVTGSAPVYACRAWVNFNGTGTPAIRASGNVSSITDVNTGRYKVNFTTNMQDTNYAVAIASSQANNNISQVHNVEAPNVAYVEFQRKENNTNYDSPYIFVTVIR